MAGVIAKKLVAAGHICLDITPTFPREHVNRIDEVLIPGRLIQMGKADVHTGGSVANTGLAMKILGADVALMGKVGKDSFGEIVLSTLESYEASEGMSISEDTETSYSVVLAPYGIDRIFLHNSGANDTFSIDDLNFNIIKDASIFHFGYPPLMRRMSAQNGKELVEILQRVKSLGVATSLDMASVDENSTWAKIDWKTIIKNVIPYVDFFVPSVEELCSMIDPERFEKWKKRAKGEDITSILDIEKDVKPLADMLLSWGAKVLLIKCGAPGIYLRTNKVNVLEEIGEELLIDVKEWAEISHFEKSYKPAQILSGTGAGDTSIAAFLTAISKGYSWDKCLKLAAATGACCVSAYDALSGLQPFEKLLEKIESGWEKQTF